MTIKHNHLSRPVVDMADNSDSQWAEQRVKTALFDVPNHSCVIAITQGKQVPACIGNTV